MDSTTSPYLSVILTTFNEVHHLDRILQDLAKQSYPDEKLELLVLEAGEENEAEFAKNWEIAKFTQVLPCSCPISPSLAQFLGERITGRVGRSG